MSKEWKPKCVVFAGGGIKGFAHAGVLMSLQLRGLLDDVRIYAGSSIGSFVAALCALGVSSVHIAGLMFKADIQTLNNQIGSCSRILLGESLINDVWLDNFLQNCLNVCEIKSDITFEQSYGIHKRTLVITTVCRQTHKLMLLSHVTTPDLKITDAIRMSCRVPLLMSSPPGHDKTFWDGGILDNYPVSWFHPASDVLGIRLGLRNKYASANIQTDPIDELWQEDISPFHLLTSKLGGYMDEFSELIWAMMDEIEELRTKNHNIKEICVDVDECDSFDFGVAPMLIDKLINFGITAGLGFTPDHILKQTENEERKQTDMIEKFRLLMSNPISN